MKHILILLFNLLLSSFLTSCDKKEETLYQWETSSGYEWKEIGEKDTQIQYRGFVDDGSPEGLGVMVFPDGRKYVGEFKDGKNTGQGTLTLPDGKKFVGEFKDGKFHGQGTVTVPDGRKYVGEFKDGEKHGKGTFTFHDGRVYVGEFRKNKPWNGKMYDKNRNILGRFVNGVKQ